jgi:predicted lipid-binding transport protein (Tim44 family)
MFRNGLRSLFAVLAVLAVFAVVTHDADARSRGSVGSRGTRTYSAPAPTATAPSAARPIERSAIQPGAATAARPATTTPAAAGGGLFNRPGLLGGLAAGFLGAGLFGLLAGHGLMGGLGGIASFLGLLLQVGIVALVAMLAWRWWQRRSQPAYAGVSSMQQGPSGGQRPGLGGFPGFGGLGGRLGGGLGGGLAGGFGGGSAPVDDAPLETKPEDFDAFEKLLGEVLAAYGNEDLGALRARVTPEMLSYYSEELSRNASQGDINQISDVKLLQGDLSEAWREGQDEYATVAMRYSLKDRVVERASGRLIEELPSEVTELWTFRRISGGQWILSAVQQTN